MPDQAIHMMQVIHVHEYGEPEQLRIEQRPRPEPKEGEVLIRVHATGVLPIECKVRQGLMAKVMPRTFPYIPGSAFAGVIEEVGSGVTAFHKGQAICGRSVNGTYAEYTTTLAEVPKLQPNATGFRQSNLISLLAPKPEMLSFEEAATLSGGATTAWNALFEDGDVRAEQRVFIHGGSGGVGLFAVQFARWKGAEVIATTSTANVDFVRSLGAEQVIDYTTTSFDKIAQNIDFVLDTIGGETLQRSMHIVKRGGTLVSVIEPPSPELAQELGIRAVKNAVIPTSENLQKIIQVLEEGHAKPVIQEVFSLYEAPQAHALCQTGHGRGRIVLHIAD